MKKIILIYSIIITGFLAFLYGCSEVKDDLAVVQNSGTHVEGWNDPASSSFHSFSLAASQFDYSSCKTCHGGDFSGGTSNSSCLTCHPSGPSHQEGWVNPSTQLFHGKYLATSDWNLNNCKVCHGNDYSGGTSGVSCLTCHSTGPETCNLCHGNSSHIYPPLSLSGNSEPTQQGVGAHNKHLSSDSLQRISAQVDCGQCHLPVSAFSDPDHIKKDMMNKASIVFGDLAKTVTTGVTPDPQFNSSTQTCSDVYCHGAFKNGNRSNSPVFLSPNSQGCGKCHGNPTTGDPLPGGLHPQNPNCYLCHGVVINQSRQIINRQKHVNGVVNFSND
ncbi:MAG: CxxxxCH/CxxCH domain-containing protein [Ignavibacteria bacterium]|jgi:predicted CxxxxCH...CXXCH cytochrome family protein|nr:CxxxxCH/CxxCH domain-containing protein [Ignavibacteria bacterium]